MPRFPTIALLLALVAGPSATAAEPSLPSLPSLPPSPPSPPSQVMVVGLFHFSNPGRDMFNLQVDDVLAAGRQAEIARIVGGLARFGPTAVMVEWKPGVTDERYAAYRAGTLDPSRNEVVQLGFRLAARMELGRVHGIDVDGEFPFGPVKAFADTHGGGAHLDGMLAQVGREVQEMSRRIGAGSLGSVLRYTNTAGRARENHGFYLDLLRFGEGEDQPGAALASAWYARNLGICARLLQALPAGGRAVVFYGDGHAHLLRQCVIEAPGVELVEANDWLVD